MSLTQQATPSRNRIESGDIKRWAKHWNVRPEDIQAAIEKVGNSVGAVEKQLGINLPGSETENRPVDR